MQQILSVDFDDLCFLSLLHFFELADVLLELVFELSESSDVVLQHDRVEVRLLVVDQVERVALLDDLALSDDGDVGVEVQLSQVFRDAEDACVSQVGEDLLEVEVASDALDEERFFVDEEDRGPPSRGTSSGGLVRHRSESRG